jgi:hypothetical protein
MSGTEEQIEIDLGDMPKTETKAEKEQDVEIVDDVPLEAAVEEGAAPASEAEDKPDDVQEAIRQLNSRLEQERLARIEAERRAKEAAQKAQMASGEAFDTNMHLVASAIDTINRDQEVLKAHLRDSMAIGDFDKAAEIQAAMTSNFSKLGQLERGYEEMKASQQRMTQQPPASQEVTVDDLIGRVTPKSAEWLKSNRQHLPDQRSIRIMARAHEDAVDLGIQPESDAYFRFVESRLGIGAVKQAPQEIDDAMSEASKPAQKRSSPTVAPVSRTASNRPGVVKLTAAEVEAAKISGISPQEYYRLKTQDRNRN